MANRRECEECNRNNSKHCYECPNYDAGLSRTGSAWRWRRLMYEADPEEPDNDDDGLSLYLDEHGWALLK